ncbi:MAG: phosphoglucosamine mutase [Alphaproteobacteria bacterium]|nr:phosphoglucosamine mutase [Alphaproteobacteria bacterium]NCQ89219.1 phosphoglucosamine mutase [Alphaproteobacteria bacterium]NCT08105.1 phosphoglucosamine mutase [Alphaproteobacteria bacterium]
MTRQYFGTDGIRGTANKFPMTAGMALKVAMAAAHVMRARSQGKPMNRVVIGKDTRLSGYMLEQAMASGFVSMGMDVILTGPIPTPAVARLTSTLRADIGVMISASHNPYQDNGIKLFGSDGYKLSDDIELAIEAAIDQDLESILPPADKLGKASRLDDAPGRYVEYIKRSFPKGETLEGMKIVIDCAHGAAYKVAPQVLWELEADLIKIGDKPNGRNINDGYGATSTKNLQETVIETGADIGIALDGDADRLIVVDEKGDVVDGDQLMALLAVMKQRQGFLKNNTVVATVMSNLGLEKFLQSQDIHLLRTAVGDRYVVEKMREGDFNLGGEQSGHIVLSDFGTTGDGLLAALQVLAAVKESGKKVSAVCHVFDPYPQVLKNVTYASGKPLDEVSVKQAISEAETKLSNDGRLLVRASGTEPLIRVMAEGQDLTLVNEAVDHVCAAVQQYA